MKDLERAKVMERVLRDMNGEGNSVATLAKRFSLSEESIRTVLGIRPEEPEVYNPKHYVDVPDYILSSTPQSIPWPRLKL